MYRIGIDVGGTFTDVTLLNSETGAYYTYKLSSTLHDQSEAIANGTKETLDEIAACKTLGTFDTSLLSPIEPDVDFQIGCNQHDY